MNDLIYHVTFAEAWDKAKEAGFYTAPSLYTEGFIHCSKARQVAGVINRYFRGHTNLVKLSINPAMLKAELKYELAPSVNEHFPHVYGQINTEAVVSVEYLHIPAAGYHTDVKNS